MSKIRLSEQSAELCIPLERRDTATFVFTHRDADGVAINLTGCSAALTVMVEYGQPAELTLAGTITPLTGVVSFTFTESAVDGLTLDSYVFEYHLTDSYGAREKKAKGTIEVAA